MGCISDQSTASPLKQALEMVRDLKQTLDRHTNEPIAITGMSCRFPGADSLEAYWSLMIRKQDAIAEIPEDRWSSKDLYDPDPLAQGKIATRWAGMIDCMAFDNDFFGISAAEALHMDPQQRVFLEVAWEALEHAGQTRETLRGSQTGIFVGAVNYNDGYARKLYSDVERINAYSGPGISNSVLAGRLAYLLDLRGPCLAIDTACSSSLVAVHQACQSLRMKECDQAVAGGVNIVLSSEFSMATSRMLLLAADGRCKSFDDRADGIVRSDGCGAVVLRRLGDARRDRDPIFAVIHGSAINQDGRTNGMTAPSGHAQEALLRRVIGHAKIEADDLGYIEAHGTGTKLGDPIEVAALGKVMSARNNPQPCLVGSVKANIGHCEAAAGIASLLKVVLCLQHRRIPGQAHLETLNSHIEPQLCGLLDFPSQAMPWPVNGGKPQLALVSSFGWSGTNAQMIVGPSPESVVTPVSNGMLPMVTLAGNTPQELHAAGLQLAAQVKGLHPDDSVADLCTAPAAAPYRKAFIAGQAGELIQPLQRWLDQPDSIIKIGKGLAVVFSGQGNQWPGMVDELLCHAPAFRTSLLECDMIVQRIAGWSLVKMIEKQSTCDLTRTELAQPCIVAIQLAMFDMLRSWGLKPAAVMGHSVGEFSAACCAGILGREETLRAVINRGISMAVLHDQGSMYAAMAPRDKIVDLIDGHPDAAISAYNSPMATIISVAARSCDMLLQRFAVEALDLIPVNPHYPFHCPLIEPLLDELHQGFSHLHHKQGNIAFVSSSCLSAMDKAPECVDYWIQNALRPVLFEQAVEKLTELGCNTFIELGPHAALLQHIRNSSGSRDISLRIMGMLQRNRPLSHSLAQVQTALYESGQPLHVPESPFYSQRQWKHTCYDLPAVSPSGKRETGPLLGQMDVALSPMIFRAVWAVSSSPLLGDHCMFDKVVVPGAVHLSVLASIGMQQAGLESVCLSDISFIRPIVMKADANMDVRIEFAPSGQCSKHYEGRIYLNASMSGQESVLLSTSSVKPAIIRKADAEWAALQDEVKHAVELDSQVFYDKAYTAGLQLGPMFRKIERLWLTENKQRLILKLHAASTEAGNEGLVFDPGLLDSCFQALFAAYWQQLPEADLFIPLSIGEMSLIRPVKGPLWGIMELTCPDFSLQHELITGNLTLFDEQGNFSLSLEHIQLKKARREALMNSGTGKDGQVFQLSWHSLPRIEKKLDGFLSFVLIGQMAMADALTASLKNSGHKAVWLPTADNMPDHVNSVVYSVSLQHYSDQGWAASIADELEKLRDLVNKLDRSGIFPVRLFLLTQGQNDRQPENMERYLIEGALAAIIRVIAREYPDIECSTIDLPVAAAHPDFCIEMIVSLLLDARGGRVVRIEGERMLQQSIEQLEIAEQNRLAIDGQARYLITGGFADSGQALMRQMIECGARYITLMGRSHPSRALIEEANILKDSGIQLHLFQGDVTVAEDVSALMRHVQRQGQPLKGIYHLAGVVEDALLSRMSSAAVLRVLAPKVNGCWHLHQAVEGMQLDWFIVFSSLSTCIGLAGQSAYAAGNAFAERLMRYRNAKGLPGSAIMWGPWSGGMTARLSVEQRDQFRNIGLGILSPEQVAVMALNADIGHHSSTLVAKADIATLDRLVCQKASSPADSRETTFEHGSNVADMMMNPLHREKEITRLFIEEITPMVSGVTLASDTVLSELNIDSLTAVSIIQRIRKRTGKPLSISTFFENVRLGDVINKFLESY